ncbi:MAG: DinB family protein [Dehalococcoidia bacterium]
MSGYLEQLVEFDAWATRRLIEVVAEQPAEILSATAPGTYGTVLETLAHMLTAQQSYAERLAGRRPPPDPAISTLDEVQSLAERTASVLGEAIASPPQPDERIKRTRGWANASTIVTQLAHHGGEHRAQIAMILSTHGVELPHMDAWAHGISIGAASLGE